MRIKQILNDIILYTYGENCNPQYYCFYLEFSKKNSRSKNGSYHFNSHKITICNAYRDDASVLCTIIHELAHHIDYCNRKTSNHQAPFYAEYEKLLFTAMDMGVIDKKQLLSCERDSSDANKVKKIVNRYIPHPIPYKTDEIVISVYNSYQYKDILKNNGYNYNPNTRAWEKITTSPEEEMQFLQRFSDIEIKQSKTTDFSFEGKIVLVIIGGDSYSIKEELKELGFKFINKHWTYQTSDKSKITELKKILQEKYPNLYLEIK